MSRARDPGPPLARASDEIVDVAIRLGGGRLPVDHAHALSLAIREALPWFADAPCAGLHLVHVAASASGWQRPDGDQGRELHLSRRTRLKLRVGAGRAADVLALGGKTLQVGGYPLGLGAGKVVPLAPSETLLARHVVCEADEPESAFIARIAAAVAACGARAASMLCGRSQRIVTPHEILHTRSVVVADLDPPGSLALQRLGVGPGRLLGCGLFIAYKRID